MPGAVDVLVQIQFEADDAILKEINAQLEQENNLLKTIEERLRQLNETAKGQSVLTRNLKQVNAEILQTNKLLQRMQSSYKDVDIASDTIKKQSNKWGSLAMVIKQTPDATSKLKNGLYDVIGALPGLSGKLQEASNNSGRLLNQMSLGKATLTLYAGKILEQSIAARAATAENRKYSDSLDEINARKQRSISKNAAQEDGAVNAAAKAGAPAQDNATGTQDKFMQGMQRRLEKLHDEQRELEKKDKATNEQVIQADVEQQRLAEQEKLSIYVATAKKKEQLQQKEIDMIHAVRAAIDEKYAVMQEAELRRYDEHVAELSKKVSDAGAKNAIEAMGLQKDGLAKRFEQQRAAEREETAAANEYYDKLRKEAEALSLDVESIEDERQAKLLNIQVRGEQKRLEEETSYYDEQLQLMEQEYEMLKTTAETALLEQLKTTKDPAKKKQLANEHNKLLNVHEALTMEKQLGLAEKELETLQNTGVATEKQLNAVESKIARLKKGIAELEEEYEAMNQAARQQVLNGVNNATDNIDKSIEAIGSVAHAFMEAEQQKTAVLIEEQQKRVERASKIAKDGNTEMLKAEQDRLANLEKKQREYVYKQKFLNGILIASQQAVNITQAITGVLSAAPGDPYSLPVRVLAAVASIIAGVAMVTVSLSDINSKTGYAKGGYTGDGARNDEAGVVHKGEYVMPQDTVRRYGRQALEAIHYGRIPIEALTGAMSVNYAGMLQSHNNAKNHNSYDMRRLESKFDQLLEAYNNNGGTQLNIDENGFVAIYSQHVKNKTRINKLR